MDDTYEPRWVVHTIIDTERQGRDFAYTDGLTELGKPELHLWQRPTHGLDPGADFALTMNDAGAFLNRCADRLLTGELDVGSCFTEDFDGGTSFGRFTVGEPVVPAAVEAHQLASDATVLPVRWELVRPPAAGPRPVPQEVRDRIAAYSVRVRERAEKLADSVELNLPYLDAQVVAEFRMLEAFARSSGRGEDLEWCVALAASDADALLEHADGLLEGVEEWQRGAFRAWLHQGVLRVLSCTYGSWLLDDVLVDGAARICRSIVDADLDPAAAEQRFWDLDGTVAIREAAAALTDEQALEVANTIHPEQRAEERAEFMDALWWASAVVLAEHAATPTNEGMIGERAGLADEPWNWAACVVTGAAFAAVLDGRDEDGPAVGLLREPWRRIRA